MKRPNILWICTDQQRFDTLGCYGNRWVHTPNLEILRLLVTDPEYASRVAPATLRIADGMPLIWASRLQGTPLPERVAGSEEGETYRRHRAETLA